MATELILRCPYCDGVIDNRPLTREDVHDLFGPDIPKPEPGKTAYLMVWQLAPCEDCKRRARKSA